jgi:hypothetical protein
VKDLDVSRVLGVIVEFEVDVVHFRQNSFGYWPKDEDARETARRLGQPGIIMPGTGKKRNNGGELVLKGERRGTGSSAETPDDAGLVEVVR